MTGVQTCALPISDSQGRNLIDSNLLSPNTTANFSSHLGSGTNPPAGRLPYSGKTLPKATFNQLSDDDKKKFIQGGGSTN